MAIYNKKELKVPYTIYLKYTNVEFMRKRWGKTSCNKVDSFLDEQREDLEKELPLREEFTKIWNSWDYDKKRAHEKESVEHYKKALQEHLEEVSVYNIPKGILLRHYIIIKNKQVK
jgi:hypothetical protein